MATNFMPFDGVGEVFIADLDSDGAQTTNLKKFGNTQGMRVSPEVQRWSIQNLENAAGGLSASGTDLTSLDGSFTLSSMNDETWRLLMFGSAVKTVAAETETSYEMKFVGTVAAGDYFPLPVAIDMSKPVVVGTFTGDTPVKATATGISPATDYEVLGTGIRWLKDQVYTSATKVSITVFAKNTTKIALFEYSDRLITLVFEGVNRRVTTDGAIRLTLPNVSLQIPPSFDFKAEGSEYQTFEVPFSATKRGTADVGEWTTVTN